ncbi:hypothetical protein HaLaN_16798 [Haematococcus lacustris]|uniref:Uncharacterized protein n=1 Tax=Haematococcus lacustris TaxID=44745 RepID=A0A699ZDA5_HAELA|nr:hypothetical protein HaLaN_16798 [Haematococcus lacustris]
MPGPAEAQGLSAQLFDQLGGWDQLVAGVQQLYQRLGADPATQAFFPDTDLKRLSRHMVRWLQVRWLQVS